MSAARRRRIRSPDERGPVGRGGGRRRHRRGGVCRGAGPGRDPGAGPGAGAGARRPDGQQALRRPPRRHSAPPTSPSATRTSPPWSSSGGPPAWPGSGPTPSSRTGRTAGASVPGPTRWAAPRGLRSLVEHLARELPVTRRPAGAHASSPARSSTARSAPRSRWPCRARRRPCCSTRRWPRPPGPCRRSSWSPALAAVLRFPSPPLARLPGRLRQRPPGAEPGLRRRRPARGRRAGAGRAHRAGVRRRSPGPAHRRRAGHRAGGPGPARAARAGRARARAPLDVREADRRLRRDVPPRRDGDRPGRGRLRQAPGAERLALRAGPRPGPGRPAWLDRPARFAAPARSPALARPAAGVSRWWRARRRAPARTGPGCARPPGPAAA